MPLRVVRFIGSSSLLQSHDERRSTIQAPRFFAGVVVLGPLFAITDRLQPVRWHAAAGEVITHGSRAAIAQREVVTRLVRLLRGPEDDVHAALATMKQHRVRRLPVEGFGGTVLGIISMNDILLVAGAKKPVRDAEVVDTFQAICAHHHPSPHSAATLRVLDGPPTRTGHRRDAR